MLVTITSWSFSEEGSTAFIARLIEEGVAHFVPTFTVLEMPDSRAHCTAHHEEYSVAGDSDG